MNKAIKQILMMSGGKTKYGTAGTTTTTTLASQGGLLINIDSATGTATNATSGMQIAIEDEKFNWFIYSTGTNVGTSTGQFVTGAGGTGSRVLRYSIAGLTNVGTTFCRAESVIGAGTATITTDNLKYLFPVKPSTKYKMTIRFKLTSWTTVGTSPGVAFALDEIGATGTRTATSSAAGATYTSVMSAWQYETMVFTTNASSAYIDWAFYMRSGNGTLDIDYNAWTLEEVVEPVANSLTSSSPSLVSVTAVGSTDNIDQSQLTNSANYPLGDLSAVYFGQQFLPRKSKLTGVVIQKHTTTGSYTGNITVAIVNDNAGVPGSTILATSTISNATWVALTVGVDYTVNLPCNLTVGGSTKYWIRLFSSTSSATDYARIKAVNPTGYADGGIAYGVDGVTYPVTSTNDLYFKTLYYKPTTNFKASQNNSTMQISADEDGFQYGSILNLTTGTYSFATPYSNVVGTTALLNQILCYSQTGLMTQSSPTDINWRFAHTIIFKVKIPIYSTGRTANLIFGTLYNTTGQTVTYSYSYDNVTYYTAQTDTTAGLVSYLPGGLSIPITNNSPDGTLYIRYQNSGGDNRLYWVGMNTTVDTSSLSTLKNYPTNKDIIKQYATTLSGPTTSATYRATKWGFPAIEYSSTEYQYLDVDTTATGSTVAFSELGTTYTTVADGASLAISSTSTPNIFVKANITANRLYSSSNDYVANSDKDGSLRQSLTYQVIQ